MAHDVLFKCHRSLGNSWVVFEVKNDKEILGRLKIAKGSSGGFKREIR